MLAHLAEGVTAPDRIGIEEVDGERATRFRGRVIRCVSPRGHRLRSERHSVGARNDYPAKPFGADFWLDDEGRVRRVLVSYRTTRGTPIFLDGRFSQFGSKVDVTLPDLGVIEDISP